MKKKKFNQLFWCAFLPASIFVFLHQPTIALESSEPRPPSGSVDSSPPASATSKSIDTENPTSASIPSETNPKLKRPKITTTTSAANPDGRPIENGAFVDNKDRPPNPNLKKPKTIALENLDCNKLAADVKAQAFKCLYETSQTKRAQCCQMLSEYFSEQAEGIAVCQAQIKVVHKEVLDTEKKRFPQQPLACE